MKKRMIAITLVLVILSLSAAALAAPATWGTSCPDPSTGNVRIYVSGNANFSGKSLADIIKSFCFPGTQSAPSSRDAEKAGQSAPTAAPSASPAPEAAPPAVPETDRRPANQAAPEASRSREETASASGSSLYDRLVSLLSKCGADSNLFQYLLQGCGIFFPEDTQTSGPAPSATPAPTARPQPAPSATPSAGSGKPAPSQAPGSGVLSFEQQVATLVNEQRAAYGLAPLTLSTSLSNVARVKSQDMHDKGYFAHQSPTYGSPFDMLAAFGISYRTAGENIAMGYATPQAVVTGWMNSQGHRANILNSSYTQIGVGYVADGHYWTQLFIG